MKKFIKTAIVAAYALPLMVSATGTPIGDALRKQNIEGFIIGLGNWFTGIVVAVSTIMILWAAFLFVTAQDNDTQITKAKSTVFWGIVGLFVGLLASSLADIVASYFQP